MPPKSDLVFKALFGAEENKDILADFFGEENENFAVKLSQARESATEKLVAKAIECGSDAIIGLDFDYINFTGNLIGVIANGTAVSIEKLNGGPREGTAAGD